MRMKERLYLNEDRTKAVSEEDRSGRHLLCKKGSELDDAIAARFGLVDGRLPAKQTVVETITEPEAEAIETPQEAEAVEEIEEEPEAEEVEPTEEFEDEGDES